MKKNTFLQAGNVLHLLENVFMPVFGEKKSRYWLRSRYVPLVHA